MYIKKILEYQYNYAEFVVTDGVNDIVCMDLTVPLPNGKEPRTGMKIGAVLAFSKDDSGVFAQKIQKMQTEQTYMTKDPHDYFRYTIQGQVVDAAKAIVAVGGIEISLLNVIPGGFDGLYKLGDIIRFVADRLDCIIEEKGITVL